MALPGLTRSTSHGADTQPSQDRVSRDTTPPVKVRPKLHGRAFYESLGSPKMILAPMVDQSEFVRGLNAEALTESSLTARQIWRLLTRSFLPPERSKELLAYTPMMHSRLFCEMARYRERFFQPIRSALPSPPDAEIQKPPDRSDAYLDGHPAVDRPLFVQFCSNDPEDLLQAARYVQPFCDAVDLNLGCPQGIAKKGNYGAFLQEDPDLIHNLIHRLYTELDIPVTAKIRILQSREETLAYARMVLDAGASILTVHGRRREQKSHNTGLADWSVIRYLRENLPADTVIFANGNILTHDDLEACLAATAADGVMSAEGNLCDPTIFAEPPPDGSEGREYWRGRDGKGGYRMDAVLRRYLDLIYKYILETTPPTRPPLFLPSDPVNEQDSAEDTAEGPPPTKKQKRNKSDKSVSPNLGAMQAHLFHLLRPLVAKHTNIRDALAKCRPGDMPAYEGILSQVEQTTRSGLVEYETEQSRDEADKTTSASTTTTTSTTSAPGPSNRTTSAYTSTNPNPEPSTTVNSTLQAPVVDLPAVHSTSPARSHREGLDAAE
ncbi:MAG: hypothetical protein M1838_004311 [Thelocarpon superellum]|nr:MAG: hypothetical protein M1838_004311 [Thelocarpon superellum]